MDEKFNQQGSSFIEEYPISYGNGYTIFTQTITQFHQCHFYTMTHKKTKKNFHLLGRIVGYSTQSKFDGIISALVCRMSLKGFEYAREKVEQFFKQFDILEHLATIKFTEYASQGYISAYNVPWREVYIHEMEFSKIKDLNTIGIANLTPLEIALNILKDEFFFKKDPLIKTFLNDPNVNFEKLNKMSSVFLFQCSNKEILKEMKKVLGRIEKDKSTIPGLILLTNEDVNLLKLTIPHITEYEFYDVTELVQEMQKLKLTHKQIRNTINAQK